MTEPDWGGAREGLPLGFVTVAVTKSLGGGDGEGMATEVMIFPYLHVKGISAGVTDTGVTTTGDSERCRGHCPGYSGMINRANFLI